MNASTTLDTYGEHAELQRSAGNAAAVRGALRRRSAGRHARPRTSITRGDAQTNRRDSVPACVEAHERFQYPWRRVWRDHRIDDRGGEPRLRAGRLECEQRNQFNGAHAATSVIADAVTLLSNAWSDTISFTQPYIPGGRVSSGQLWYRMAIIAGKGPAFPQPAPARRPISAPTAARTTSCDISKDGDPHRELPGLDCHLLLQPAGGRHV